MTASTNKLSFEEVLPLAFCAAGIAGVFPFAVLRYISGDVVVGLLDSTIVLGLVALAWYVYRSRNVRAASLCIAVLCVSGMIATVYLTGATQVFWAFPAMVAVFFLLHRHEAVALNALGTLLLFPALLPGAQGFEMATIVITIAVTNAFAYAFATVTSNQRNSLMRLATIDPLTGVGNRRALDERLTAVIAHHDRQGEAASLLLIDLDHFKRVNDTHGHAAGDRILVALTDIIRKRIRANDSLFRIGGEEFVVVADGQNVVQASILAEQLRTLVETANLHPDSEITISVGVAQVKNGEHGAGWLRRADEALYAAKRAGRNLTHKAA